MPRDPSVPENFHPGIVHFALAMGGFTIGTTEFASMSLLPFFSADLGIDAPTAGHVISAYALGVVVGAPLIALLAAKLSRRTLLIGLMLVFALANGSCGLAVDYRSLLALRFLSGLPHGAYFGIAALVAASLVPLHKRAEAVGRVMLGLTVATTIGVPAASWIGYQLGWRWGYAIVAALALLTVVLVALFAPRDRVEPGASLVREFAGLARLQLWLTLAIGAIGFGGMFAVYTYLASTLMEETGVGIGKVSLALAMFGLGMTAGNIIVPRFAAHALMKTAGLLLVWSAAMMLLYSLVLQSYPLILLVIVLIGLGGAIGTLLQTRLMDVAGDSQALAAALNHSAFNAANALGPWLAGMTIAAGHGWRSAGWVGCGLALAGLMIWGVAMLVPNRTA